MRSKLSLLVLFLVAAMAISAPAFADLSSTDTYELNNATPGLSKVPAGLAGVGFGNLIRGSRLNQVYGSGLANVASSLGNVDSSSPITTVTPYHVVIWNVPLTNYSLPLGSGITGQRLVILKGNTGSTAGKISPVTKNGFTDATLTNQGDGVELEWHDSTGWLPASTFGGSTQGKINP